MKKAVFIRLDKIGDLICTLPVDQVEYFRDWEITWVIAKGLSFIPDHAIPQRKYIELDKHNPAQARQRLQSFLETYQPDVAVSFQAPWWVQFLLWKNHVKKRIGVLSKWDSFLFLNAGLRQKRSQAVQHEADYNLDLIRQIEPGRILETSAPILRLQAQEQDGLMELYGLQAKAYVVVHPGMAGSALNWPTEYYVELIQNLTARSKVVLTGTPADETWLTEIKTQFKGHPQVLCLQNKLNTSQLLSLLAKANAVFAPSTGVLHLAASLGTQVFGFYSPIRVQKVIRWGARGSDTHLFTPAVDCPAIHECLGPSCPAFSCMKRVTPTQILKELT